MLWLPSRYDAVEIPSNDPCMRRQEFPNRMDVLVHRILLVSEREVEIESQLAQRWKCGECFCTRDSWGQPYEITYEQIGMRRSSLRAVSYGTT